MQTKAPDGTFSPYAACTAVANAAERIDIEIDSTRFLERPDEVIGLGLGLNWLLDSDIHRPRTRTNVEAVGDLGAGMLRFPFGLLTFPDDTTIAPGGFLVLTNALVAFHTDHPDVPAIEWMAGAELGDDGQKLELLTPTGVPVE